MNYFDLYSSYPDRTIAGAWDSQVKEADNAPWLAEMLPQHGSEIFLRFAACYAELSALPRSARRALQRRLAQSSELAATLPEYLQQGGRRLQHRMAWSLAGAALLLALGQGPANAATITVTTSNPNIAADGQCSLIEAIVNANDDAPTHADCAAGSGADTIVLPPNANVTLSAVFGNIYSQFGSPVGLPLITSRITIEGNGATIARQAGAPAFRLMHVRGNFLPPQFPLLPQPTTPGDLTLQSVTLSGGSSFIGGVSNAFGGTLAIKSSTISGNTGSGVSNSGTLIVQNSTISGNAGDGVSGGGTLTIENSTISGNTGRGVSNGGTLTIENSTVSGNTGSGVSNFSTLTIKNSTISGNTSNSSGGGVSNYGTLAIEKSLISANTSNSKGGGLSNSGTLTITNSTISGNLADQGGGVVNSASCNRGYYFFGVYCSAGSLTITNSTISANLANQGGGVVNSLYCYFNTSNGSNYCPPAAVLSLNRSLIAGNQAPVAPEGQNISGTGASTVGIVNANNFNLFGANGNAGVSGFTPGPTDIVPSVSLAQILAPLQNNGGPTQTHALFAGSPAIDAGDPSGCGTTTDQRGFARPVDGNNDGTVRCDIGAFERNAQDINTVISISDVTVTEGNGGTVNATFEVKLSEPSTQPVTVTFSTANRTAIAGTDFEGTSGTVTFNPGETTKTITVAVNANTILELDKSFFVNLTSATNAFIGDGQAVGTIINDDGALPERLSNISTRGRVLTGDSAMIGGFIIDGSVPKRVLVRSRGPSMAGQPFNVPGTLANPFVQLFSGQTVIAQNDNWQDPPSCFDFVCEGATEIVNLGFDPCTPNPGQIVPPPSCALESAILITLPPGAYTAIVTGADGRTGLALVEVFEADARTLSELSNISARGFVQSGANVMIGGLIIEGSAPGTVLIRARGPSMSGAPFYVPGTLANPFLQLIFR